MPIWKPRSAEDPRNPLTAWRQERGLSQSALAMAIGLTQPAISGVERGRMAELSPRLLAGLKGLGIDTEKLKAEYQAWRDMCGEEARAALLGGQAHG